ncbi:MAG TPA: glycosyltransferase [Ktedonobacteraceae bacterium]|nr:glycosyltransferase [Ktedonobacteraceae bacterium]
MTKRIALYWHNGRSLGHTIRSATLGQGFLQRMPGSAVMGITGASKGLELLPPGMDVVKIPSYLAFDHAQGAVSAPIMPITREDLARMRENLIATFVRDFRPHAWIVDYHPQGNDGELVPAVTQSPATQKVLGLRGILGTPEQTNSQFFSPRMADFIRANYAAIHVYVDERVFRLEEYYDVPASLLEMLRYTGYVTRPTAATKQEARTQLNLESQARIVVASFGGGQGTEQLWQAILQAMEGISHTYDLAYFAAGPYLEADAYMRLQKSVAHHANWHWIRLLDPLPMWMKASDLFIGSGGYNSLSEVLATGANALIIPRQLNEREQLLHATSLAKLQALRLLDLETALHEDIASILETCLREPFPIAGRLPIKTDGAETNARLIEELIDA